MDYAVLIFELPEDLTDTVTGLLHANGAMGVQVQDSTAAPPGAAPLAAGRAVVQGYFEPGAPVDDVRSRIVRALAGERVESRLEVCRDEDWAESWKDHFAPVHIAGRLWIVPPWLPRPEGPTVVLEPGMAFGTGAHATTALCLELLAEIVPALPGASVLDVGCGSGILGIAARTLGAGPVVLIDNDPDAVRIATENAAANECADLVVTATPIDRVTGSFHVVVANILATPLIELAAPLAARRAVGGSLILSGILASQADEVRDAYAALGLVERERRLQGEWAVLRMEGR